MTTKEFAKILQDKLTSEYGVDLSVASKQQIYPLSGPDLPSDDEREQ